MSCRHCSVFDRWLVFCKFFNKEKLLIYYLLINCMLLQKRGTGHRQVIPPLSLVVFGCVLFAFFFLIVWALWLTADKGSHIIVSHCLIYARRKGAPSYSPGRVLLGILGEGAPPGSPNPDSISDKKCHFLHPFSDLALKNFFRHYLD